MFITFILSHLNLWYSLIKYTIACRNLGLILSFLFYFSLTSQAQLIPQWATMMGGRGNDLGSAVAVDTDGNSFVTGRFNNNSSITDFGNGVFLNDEGAYVVKYNAIGEAQWARAIARNADGHDIAVDETGNIYVSGVFNNPTLDFGSGIVINHSGDGDNDLFLVKYNTEGIALWAKSIQGAAPERGHFRAKWTTPSTSIAVDSEGNVHLAGSFSERSILFGSKEITVGGGLTGIERQKFLYPIREYSRGGKDMFVVKYNTTGGLHWAEAIGGEEDDIAKGLAVDNEGNVYLAGYSNSTVLNAHEVLPEDGRHFGDTYLFKFKNNGIINWARGFTTNSSTPIQNNLAITVDVAQNAYIVGKFRDSVDFGDGIRLTEASNSDSFMAKYDIDGTPQWANNITKGMDVSRAGHDVLSVAVDRAGYTYVTGYFYLEESGDFSLDFGDDIIVALEDISDYQFDMFLVQYNDNGQAIWASSYGQTQESEGSDVIVDQNDNVYLVGQSKNVHEGIDFGNDILAIPANFHDGQLEEDMFLAKFSKSLIAGLITPDQYFDQGFNFSTMDLNKVFASEPLNTLNFTASSDNEKVATVFLEDAQLIIKEQGIGTITITVAAKDKKGEVVKTQFKVTVSKKKNDL